MKKLKLRWSPQQISGWLRYRQDKMSAISHERIYQDVWDDKLHGGTLYRKLRHNGNRYKSRSNRYGRRFGPIPDRVDIDRRPAIVERKSRIGYWELDTIIGAQHRGALVSMAERKSKPVRLALVQSTKSEEVGRAIETCLGERRNKPPCLRRVRQNLRDPQRLERPADLALVLGGGRLSRHRRMTEVRAAVGVELAEAPGALEHVFKAAKVDWVPSSSTKCAS